MVICYTHAALRSLIRYGMTILSFSVFTNFQLRNQTTLYQMPFLILAQRLIFEWPWHIMGNSHATQNLETVIVKTVLATMIYLVIALGKSVCCLDTRKHSLRQLYFNHCCREWTFEIILYITKIIPFRFSIKFIESFSIMFRKCKQRLLCQILIRQIGLL